MVFVHRAVRRLLRVTAPAVLLLLAGCSSPSPEELRTLRQDTGVRVLVVGIDGGTFRVLEPMVQRGRLPTFATLLEEGASGRLRSARPMLSPALWTTLVTGQPRKVHGVRDFLVRGDGGRRVVTSNDRRSAALWNVASAAGLEVGFLGWWASWPAEPVNGFMVSDRMTRARWLEWHGGERRSWRTFPPELAEELEPLVFDPLDPPMEEIEGMADFTPEETAELLAARKPVMAHGPSVFKFAYCSQRSYEEMALHLLDRRGQPDLTGVFLIANDAVSHTFWHYYRPRTFDGVDREKAVRLRRLIPAMYRHNDRYLARLLAEVDPETVVMIVSDHGFQPSGRLPEPAAGAEVAASFDESFGARLAGGAVTVGQSGVHHPQGIFIARGGPVRRSYELEGASILDVTPTVLALLGLPVAEDMPGRVLTEMLDPAFLHRFPVRTIPSYDYLERTPIDTESTPGTGDEEAMEMLRALGYIQ